MMKDVWGDEIPQNELKKCRDCGEIKSLFDFSVNRKFYRNDLPDKHYLVRRPSCDPCRDLKKTINSHQKKLFPKPTCDFTCPICHDTVDKSYARLDHCHKTGTVRGWVCDNCNTGMGKLKDSVEVLQRALDWINNA